MVQKCYYMQFEAWNKLYKIGFKDIIDKTTS